MLHSQTRVLLYFAIAGEGTYSKRTGRTDQTSSNEYKISVVLDLRQTDTDANGDGGVRGEGGTQPADPIPFSRPSQG